MYRAVMTFRSRFPAHLLDPSGRVILRSESFQSVKDHADLLNTTDMSEYDVLMSHPLEV